MELNPQKLEQEYNKEVASLVDKASAFLHSKYGLWFLGSFSVVDSALGLPVSADPFMVAYMVANRAKAWWGYIITVAGSVLGGVIAYFLAEFLSERLLTVLSPNATNTIHQLSAAFADNALLLAFMGAFSPIPYTLVAITAGALKMNLFLFIVGSLIGRALRYGIVAYVVYFYGEQAVALAKRHLLTSAMFGIVLLIFYLIFKLIR